MVVKDSSAVAPNALPGWRTIADLDPITTHFNIPGIINVLEKDLQRQCVTLNHPVFPHLVCNTFVGLDSLKPFKSYL